MGVQRSQQKLLRERGLERAQIFFRTLLSLDPQCSCILKKEMIRISRLLSKLGVLQAAYDDNGFTNVIGDASIPVPKTSSPSTGFSCP